MNKSLRDQKRALITLIVKNCPVLSATTSHAKTGYNVSCATTYWSSSDDDTIDMMKPLISFKGSDWSSEDEEPLCDIVPLAFKKAKY